MNKPKLIAFIKFAIAAFIVMFTSRTIALDPQQAQWLVKPELTTIFTKQNISGTFVLYDSQTNQFFSSDSKRAKQRFIPASSFKIANTLIGLDAGAVESVDQVFEYNGENYTYDAWKKSMGLRDAIRVSNVPVYQRLARKIGKKKMQLGVNKLEYGNQNVGEQVDLFWLTGPLKISAVEQTLFLNKLATSALPFQTKHQKSVQEITIIEQGDGWQLHAKTGWTTTPSPQIGWWVGWVNSENKIYSFALNMDIINKSQLSKRKEIGRACLELLNLIPKEK